MNLLGQRDSVANKGKSSVAPLGLARIPFFTQRLRTATPSRAKPARTGGPGAGLTYAARFAGWSDGGIRILDS
ncbi:MAG TPA: hypothetical protein VKY85_09275 [Candidatus Angelobacter sp.]|nr:hypothetical protein [Candidatus Angelobacter sp.]